ncbi:hypothetical protein BpHYR1_054036 [Brachionus plicatilis]|uniref:Uncharacterized protein n=1 Tax=Brachionus plicatilis TaxID=10195 RepID=A0A3M7QGE2_BRAPC|nr:hypothetical protein BpHYR1_054036 [Brachionus plicatilis]
MTLANRISAWENYWLDKNIVTDFAAFTSMAMSSNDQTPQLSSPCYGMPPKVVKCEIYGPPPVRPVISCNPNLEQDNTDPKPISTEKNEHPKD